MISYYAAQKGCIADRPQGFMPYEYTNVAELAQVICQYTWSPIIFRGERRHSTRFEFADLCALDIDNDKPELPIISIADIKKEFADCKMIIGTSRNHQLPKNGKPPQDRFRVIIPFEKRVTSAAQYEASMRGLMGMFDFLDKACVDAARLFFPCTQLVYVQPEGEKIPVAVDYVPPKSADQVRLERALTSARPLPRHIQRFLDEGVTFGRGRNDSVFHAADYLLLKGIPMDQSIEIIKSAPFDQITDWKENEIFKTVEGVYKRAGLL